MEIAKNIIILLLTLIGIILIGYGAYLAWKPLGFIVGGLLVTGFALTLDQPFKGGGGNSYWAYLILMVSDVVMKFRLIEVH